MEQKNTKTKAPAVAASANNAKKNAPVSDKDRYTKLSKDYQKLKADYEALRKRCGELTATIRELDERVETATKNRDLIVHAKDKEIDELKGKLFVANQAIAKLEKKNKGFFARLLGK